jgi:hypothetical protein
VKMDLLRSGAMDLWKNTAVFCNGGEVESGCKFWSLFAVVKRDNRATGRALDRRQAWIAFELYGVQHGDLGDLWVGNGVYTAKDERTGQRCWFTVAATGWRLPYGEKVSFSLFGCFQDGTGLGYTAVQWGWALEPRPRWGARELGACDPLGDHASQDHGWDLCTFWNWCSGR